MRLRGRAAAVAGRTVGDGMRSSGVGVLGLIARACAVAGGCIVLGHCGQAPGRLDPKYGVSASPRLVQIGDPVPKGGGSYRVGKPYTVGGRTYNPEENPNYSATGLASWYGEDFHGRQTANGEIFDMTSISAAHPTLPIPSYARVTNLSNHRSIIVRVNDRGPYHRDRLIDVSIRTAKLLGFYDAGVARVRVDYVGRASLAGSDDVRLEATLRSGTPAPGPSEVRLASARPFMPGSRTAAVPIPADRPYELGQAQDQDRGSEPAPGQPATRVAKRPPPGAAVAVSRAPMAAPAEPQRTASAARRPMAPAEAGQSFASRFEPAANMPVAPSRVEPVSAFAPISAGPNGAVMTGRGLY
jgi:peptidoglycan lytic transglycosylase